MKKIILKKSDIWSRLQSSSALSPTLAMQKADLNDVLFSKEEFS
jgi:hypothetical protein